MLEKWVGGEGVEAYDFLSVEVQEGVASDILVDAVGVAHCPAIVGRSVENVNAISKVGMGVAQEFEKGGHNVYLLHDGRAVTARQLS